MTTRHLGLAAALAVTLFAASATAADIPAAALDPYLQIQTALAADSLDGARAGARLFAAQAGKLGSAFQTAVGAAQTLVAAPDLKTARSAFGTLSDAMLALAGSGTGGKDVRIAYCPMAKRSWLQKGSQIANPYYGSEMLRCGEFKK